MEKRSKDELLARLTDVKAEVVAINEQYEGQYIDPQSADGERWNALNNEADEIEKTVAQLDARAERVKQLAGEKANTDEGASFLTARPGAMRGQDIYDLSTIRSSLAEPQKARGELNDRARRAIESMTFPGALASREECQAQMEHLLEAVQDPQGSLARRILATSNPSYKEAFGNWIASGGTQFQATSMQVGVDGNGGYAVPVELDPTIINTSDGAVNPYRRISRIVQTTAKEWEGVSSTGVTATRRAETAEVGDNAPTLDQPTVKPTRVDVFIPFTISLETSWGGMRGELANLIQDAKDVEEASSFTSGNGTAPNPEGLLTGATVTVDTASTATFASVDLDSAEEALGPRFQSRAQWVGNRAIYNLVRHFDDAGGPDLWVRVAEGLNHGGNTGRTLLGYAANECSAMGTTHASNDTLLVFGDFSKFLIVDKLGLNMELVPHLFATANNLPNGQRGFLAYWFNSCKVLAPEAFVKLLAL